MDFLHFSNFQSFTATLYVFHIKSHNFVCFYGNWKLRKIIMFHHFSWKMEKWKNRKNTSNRMPDGGGSLRSPFTWDLGPRIPPWSQGSPHCTSCDTCVHVVLHVRSTAKSKCNQSAKSKCNQSARLPSQSAITVPSQSAIKALDCQVKVHERSTAKSKCMKRGRNLNASTWQFPVCPKTRIRLHQNACIELRILRRIYMHCIYCMYCTVCTICTVLYVQCAALYVQLYVQYGQCAVLYVQYVTVCSTVCTVCMYSIYNMYSMNNMYNTICTVCTVWTVCAGCRIQYSMYSMYNMYNTVSTQLN